MSRIVRILTALLVSCVLILGTGSVSYASDEMMVGEMEFEVPDIGWVSYINNRTTVSGPDVQANGLISIGQDKECTFTANCSYLASSYENLMKLVFEDHEMRRWSVIPLDNGHTFGIPVEDSMVEAVLEFENVSLAPVPIGSGYTPNYSFEGNFSFEFKYQIDRIVEYETDGRAFPDDFDVISGMEGTPLSEPREVVIRVSWSGTCASVVVDGGTSYETAGVGLDPHTISILDSYKITVQYDDKTTQIDMIKEKSNSLFYWLNVEMYFGLHSYSLVPLEMGGGSVNTAVRTATTAVTAAALSLGGNALASAVSSSTSGVGGYRRREDELFVEYEKSAGGEPPESIESEFAAESENMEAAYDEAYNEACNEAYDEACNEASYNEAYDDAVLENPAELEQEMPELPKENTPGIALEIECPFEDLLNSKGAAVNLELSVDGGDGLNWHYIHKVICKGAKDAVKSMVAGNVLVLGLTGAPMQELHADITVFVIAWAVGADGKILKTASGMELNLHRKGIEAERQKDGSLKVTAYTESNLDGVAQIEELTGEQYTVEKTEAGTKILAKDISLGSFLITD